MRDPFDIYPEATTADALDALYTIAGEAGAPRGINGLTMLGAGPMFGRAVTVRSLPARPDHNEAVTARFSDDGMGPYALALSRCDETSVLVIDTHATELFAAAGGTGLSSLIARGARGLLTDGVIRDRANLEQRAAAVGTTFVVGGFTPHYGTHRGLVPTDVDVPVAIAGVLIVPGDYVFADGDGVVVIPATVAEEVLEMAVVLHRSAVVMEDLLIERRGVVGVDVVGVAGEVTEEMLRRYEFSERQLELLRTKVTGVV